jgi:hypothetical protein
MSLGFRIMAIFAIVLFCLPVKAQQRITLSSLIEQGFEIRAGQASPIIAIIVQKGKDVFLCISSDGQRGGVYTTDCHPIK